jgi:hypothetical protein
MMCARRVARASQLPTSVAVSDLRARHAPHDIAAGAIVEIV